MDRLFVDTGAWYAYFNGSDPDHAAVMDRLALRIAAATDADFARAGYTAIPG